MPRPAKHSSRNGAGAIANQNQRKEILYSFAAFIGMPILQLANVRKSETFLRANMNEAYAKVRRAILQKCARANFIGAYCD
jgi:hypothetical protein